MLTLSITRCTHANISYLGGTQPVFLVVSSPERAKHSWHPIFGTYFFLLFMRSMCQRFAISEKQQKKWIPNSHKARCSWGHQRRGQKSRAEPSRSLEAPGGHRGMVQPSSSHARTHQHGQRSPLHLLILQTKDCACTEFWPAPVNDPALWWECGELRAGRMCGKDCWTGRGWKVGMNARAWHGKVDWVELGSAGWDLWLRELRDEVCGERISAFKSIKASGKADWETWGAEVGQN